ncbi:MAG: hypothetical protein DDT20_01240 [Firmicutes bacterium]|nr:hypothetical protein [Bacillota bacterium]
MTLIPPYIRELLPKVNKPARYTGGEVNAVRKPPDSVSVRIALAFPDTYEVGMSHLGLKILYQRVNALPDAAAERVYAPHADMGEQLFSQGIKLYSLENYSPLTDFDAIGFTLQYELSFTNILWMLDLAGIPLTSDARQEHHPLIIGGGPCAFNAEPVADVFDAFALGEGEEVILDILQVLRMRKAQGLSRQETLSLLATVPGVYVPSLYDASYNDDETFAGIVPVDKAALPIVNKRVQQELKPEYLVTSPVIPYTDVVHDRLMLEIFRGCARGCRFCQAGMLYRPVREFVTKDVLIAAQTAVANTGYEEISLTSLSTMDYSNISTLLSQLVEKMNCQGVNLSLPSLRVDSFSVELAGQVAKRKKSGLTLAPEAGSQRLRDCINKQVTEEDLLGACRGAARLGFKSVKLYFMIGLPTETERDLAEMVELIVRAAKILPVTVSVASFVPKPHTPFQWEAQCSMYELEERQRYLRDRLRSHKRVTFNYHDSDTSFLEAIFSRGDRRLGQVVIDAYRRGCKLDGWSEHFRFDLWMEAFAEVGIDPCFYANRARGADEHLPWEHLSPGVSRAFLWQERERALALCPTADCARGGCPGCGVCPALQVNTYTELERR